jgi:hypothetical protein
MAEFNEYKENIITIANGYYIRDVEMNITFDLVKGRALKKLGYTVESIRSNILSKFDSYLKELSIGINDKIVWNNNVPSLDNNVLQDCSYNQSIIDLFNSFMNKEEVVVFFNHRQSRMNVLSPIDDHKSFYEAMTVEELHYLGW